MKILTVVLLILFLFAIFLIINYGIIYFWTGIISDLFEQNELTRREKDDD